CAAAPARRPARWPTPSTARRPAAGADALRGRGPSQPFEAAYAPYPDLDAFGTQQFTFHLQVSAVAAQRAARRNHTMAGDARLAALLHDVADRARRSRFACQRGDISVGCHAPGWDASHRRQDPAAKLGPAVRRGAHLPRMILARRVNPP